VSNDSTLLYEATRLAGFILNLVRFEDEYRRTSARKAACGFGVVARWCDSEVRQDRYDSCGGAYQFCPPSRAARSPKRTQILLSLAGSGKAVGCSDGQI